MTNISAPRCLSLIAAVCLWSAACENLEFRAQTLVSETAGPSQDSNDSEDIDQLAAVPLPVDGAFLVPSCNWDASASSEDDLAVICGLDNEAIADHSLGFSFTTGASITLAKDLTFKATGMSVSGTKSLFSFLLPRAELDAPFVFFTVKDTLSDSILGSSTLPLALDTMFAIAQALDGLRWEMSCTNRPHPSATFCPSTGGLSKQLVLGGDPGSHFKVTLHFRGRVESKAYSGGVSDGAFWMEGGQPSNSNWNIYKLEISHPPQVFFLNNNRKATDPERTYPINYTKELTVAGGATVKVTADARDRRQVINRKIDPGLNTRGFTQFIQMNVISVSPDLK